MEERESSFCAVVVRGTLSIASHFTFFSASVLIISPFCAGEA